MASVPITAGSGTAIATTMITRDSITEQMQLVNIGDPTTGTPAGVNANGGLQVYVEPKTTTLTSTLLAASATYTGTAMDSTLDGNTIIDVSAFSSVGASATNGFSIQTSNDSSAWTTIASVTVAANAVGLLASTVGQRYWRIMYVNNTTAQTGTFTLIATISVGTVPVQRQNSGTYGGTVVPATIIGTATTSVSNSITKGTQGGTGLTVQSLKDAGRNRLVLYGTGQASTTTETLYTFTKDLGGTLTATQTLYTVTSGKTFNMQSMRLSTRYATFAATATAATLTFRLRQTSVSGTLERQIVLLGISNLAGTVDYFLPPDGFQFPASTVLAVTVLGSDTSQLADMEIVGFEY